MISFIIIFTWPNDEKFPLYSWVCRRTKEFIHEIQYPRFPGSTSSKFHVNFINGFCLNLVKSLSLKIHKIHKL